MTMSPRGRVVKVADFSTLDYSIISPLWFAPPSGHGAHVGQAKFCLRVCQVFFFSGYSGFRPTYRLIRLDMSEKA
ncbi:MAG: hypothetical protein AB2693_30840 [Candidatus Thiodiazotropha sp.]